MFDIEELRKQYMVSVLAGKLTARQAKRMLNRAIELNAFDGQVDNTEETV